MKKFVLVSLALLLLATAVSAQSSSGKMKMLVGGELGFGYGSGTFKWSYDLYGGQRITTTSAFAYNAFNIAPVFQFYPIKNEAVRNDLGFEVDARLAIGGNGWGTAFAFTPDFLAMYYFNMVPYVQPFVGAGVGLDLTVFEYPTKYTTWGFDNASHTAVRFAFAFKGGAAYNIPNTKIQVYLAEKFRIAIPFGIVNDVNAGILFRL